jgi:formylglycine-generating enzyme required for sulfatase activity/predicted Ser/Thr protein kinase
MLIKKCRQCGTEYGLSAVFCNRDGALLEEVAREDDPYLGKVILGCRILSRLGKGGMGSVYLAEHEELETKRAIKLIHRELAPDASFIERFRVEARAASRIEHPNVIKVHDFGKTDDNAFAMVMEFLEGESLGDVLKRETRLAPDRAVSIAVEIASGLTAAHALGIVHRDLKPDNVMILKNGRVKVLDFGIAKVAGAGNLTGTGNFIGTARYASPEQALGKRDEIDKPSDIFSLGMMLYEMLSGRLPYDCTGKIPLGILVDRVSGKPLPLIQALPAKMTVPETLSLAVMRALAREPQDRPASAAAFANEIEGAIRSVVVAPSTIKATEISEFKFQSKRKLTNALGIQFVLIPKGSFVMGSEQSVEDRWNKILSVYEKNITLSRERPARLVSISQNFYLGKFQITQGQWNFAVEKLSKINRELPTSPSVFKGEDLPVETVSWEDCEEFILRLNALNDGYEYRFPTEAEWEYACRAGTDGDFAGDLDAMGWYGNNSGRTPIHTFREWFNCDQLWEPFQNSVLRPNENRTHPVGQKHPNSFGLYDMHGNVWEWCSDWFDENYYSKDTSRDPKGPDSGQSRVLRGGAWFTGANYCRSALRYRYSPTDRKNFTGLRVVANATA